MRLTAFLIALITHTQAIRWNWNGWNSNGWGFRSGSLRNAPIVGNQVVEVVEVIEDVPAGRNMWLQWSGWESCKGECGRGVQLARRKCTGGIAGMGGCQGSELRKKPCPTSQIIQNTDNGYCPYWSFWSEWSVCMISESEDCCIRNNRGLRQRSRQCNDPFATEQGEIPVCDGAPVEEEICFGDNPNIINPFSISNRICGDEYIASEWSPCSSTCGPGVQTRTLTHVCAAKQGTWVDSSLFFREEQIACSTPCCIIGEWSVWNGEPLRCDEWVQTRTRQNNDIGGGCINSIPPIQVLEIEEMLHSPTDLQLSWAAVWPEDLISNGAWSGCVGQESPFKPGLITTCGVNGIQQRSQCHECVSACNGRSCSRFWDPIKFCDSQSRQCGAEIQTDFPDAVCEHMCSQPKCYSRTGCFNDYKTITQSEIECAEFQRPYPCLNEEDDHWIESYSDPNQCRCGQETYIVTFTHPCAGSREEIRPCPASTTQCAFSGWQQSEAYLRLAINPLGQRACCCIGDLAMRDFRNNMCSTMAPNGQNCETMISETDFRANAQCQENCLLNVQCEACPTCYMPGNENPTTTCWAEDMCNPGMQVEQPPRQCGALPPCCVWLEPEIVSPCTQFQCPSDGQPTQTRVTRNTCPELFEDKVEIIPCGQTLCPDWNNQLESTWTDWSECSWILPQDQFGGQCTCGGYRTRTRGYPCPTDADSGRCRPPNGVWNGVNEFANWRIQIDSVSEEHHSQYCFEQGIGNGLGCRSAWEQWTIPMLDQANPCAVNPETGRVEKRMISFRRRFERCLEMDHPQYWQNETRITFEPAMPCVNQLSGTCTWDGSRCNAVVNYLCEAVDQCSQTLSLTRDAAPGECAIEHPPPNSVQDEKCVAEFGLGWNYVRESACQDARFPGMELDICTGTNSLVCVHRCSREERQVSQTCMLPPRWSEWSPFMPEDGFASDSTVPYNQFIDGFNMAIQCNPCGGRLLSTRTLMCSYDQMGGNTEVREIICPAPVFRYSEWSDCGQTCRGAGRNVCVVQRNMITTPEAAHCPCPHGASCSEAKEIPLRPCTEVQPVCEEFCQHPRDPSATCGQGQIHTSCTFNEVNIVDGTVLNSQVKLAPYRIPNELRDAMYGSQVWRNNFQGVGMYQTDFEIVTCQLPYQPEWIVEPIPGCSLCGGGQNSIRETQVCEGKMPFDQFLPERIRPDPTNPCPPLVTPAQVTPAVAVSGFESCGPCQPYRQLERTCIGGVFSELPCECGSCCTYTPTPNTVISDDGRREIVTIGCAVNEPVNVFEVPDPACECGACTKEICRENMCTKVSECERVPDPKPVQGDYVTEWSQCIYADPSWSCNDQMAYRTRDHIQTCANGKIVNIRTPQNEVFSDCYRPSKVYERRGQCIKQDRCNPYINIEVVESCAGFERVIENKQASDPMCQPPAPFWTEWSQCPVLCGQSMQTRQYINPCNDQVLETEERACGCPIAVWSEWSEEAQMCDPCGPEEQYTIQQRHCMQPMYDNYNQYGMNVYERNCAISGCNSCQPDTVTGETTTRRVPFRRDQVCPLAPVAYPMIVCPERQYPSDMALLGGYRSADYCEAFTIAEPVIDQCGRKVDEVVIQCPGPEIETRIEEGPCVDGNGMELPCGMGFKTITTYTTCQQPMMERVPCNAGAIVELAGEFGGCSAKCGGGVRTKETLQVCANDQNIVVGEIKIEQVACAQHPCQYWGGWSTWGWCSATCGEGVQQRFRKCEGGFAGEGLCNGEALEARVCNQGDCCDMEWSGWSSCCQRNNQGIRLRWKGSCNAPWEERTELCSNLIFKDEPDQPDLSRIDLLPTCDEIAGLERRYRYGEQVYWTTQPQQMTDRVIYQAQGNALMSYGRVIQSGTYSIGEESYRIRVGVDGTTKWYVIGDNGEETEVVIEEYQYGGVWYYLIGEYCHGGSNMGPRHCHDAQWYRHSNGVFSETSIPYGHSTYPTWQSNNNYNTISTNYQYTYTDPQYQQVPYNSQVVQSVVTTTNQLPVNNFKITTPVVTTDNQPGTVIVSNNNIRSDAYSWMGFSN